MTGATGLWVPSLDSHVAAFERDGVDFLQRSFEDGGATIYVATVASPGAFAVFEVMSDDCESCASGKWPAYGADEQPALHSLTAIRAACALRDRRSAAYASSAGGLPAAMVLANGTESFSARLPTASYDLSQSASGDDVALIFARRAASGAATFDAYEAYAVVPGADLSFPGGFMIYSAGVGAQSLSWARPPSTARSTAPTTSIPRPRAASYECRVLDDDDDDFNMAPFAVFLSQLNLTRTSALALGVYFVASVSAVSVVIVALTPHQAEPLLQGPAAHDPLAATMPKKPVDGLYSKLHLRVTARTQLGQTVFVTGSSSGDRALEGRGEALEMVTSPGEWPVWRTKKPVIVARGVPHCYEYQLRKDAYLNYCKKVLWPLLHNATVLDQSCACWQDPSNPSRTWDQEADGAGWDAYEALNLDFRDAPRAARRGDTVWVHDYHLMLLPLPRVVGHWRGRVVLVQYALLDGTRVEDEARTSGELRKLAARINGQRAGAVEYREMPSSRLTLPVRLALWNRADALIGTAIREGHNLAPFEYALERRDRLDRDLPCVKSRPGQWTKEILHDMNVVHQQKRVYGDGGEDLVAPWTTARSSRGAADPPPPRCPTNGSSVLSRDPGVAWSYYRADPEWGRIQAVQLIGDLEAVLKPYDVSVVHLDGMIEVVPGRMHKGNVVKHILNTLDEPPDFLFACGDSKTDEKMFSSVYSHLADAPTAEHNQAYTVTVGKKASKALFYLNDHAHVIDALAKLASACEPAS
ncbi:hypothetical protein JL720_5740 [Aureococcus anophagefferens]|nr:hypothetical protein JL720_5740 [Aureococcus anophagefferens]